MPGCPHCGFESDVPAESCPLCGAALPGVATGDRWDRRRAADAGPSAPPIEWEDPSVPFPFNLLRTWAGILGGPTRFFSRVRFDDPLARPILFYLIVVIVAAFFQLLVTAALGVPESVEEAFGTYDLGVELSPGGLALTAFFATPFVLLLGLLINTLVIHLFVAMLMRERRTLGATSRVLCYAIAPYPLAAAPLIGPLASSIWITVLVIFGLKDAHRTSMGRAAAAVIIPLSILVGLYILLIAFALLLSVAEPV